jgi:predicted nucleic acid-binding Zn ribbon protein
MPIYSYEHVKKSNCKFSETLQKLNDEKLTKCPECGKSIKFVMGNTASPIFNCTGFYSTDYKKKIK